jgi:hypothetical protein
VETRCGIQVVDLRTGDAVHWIRWLRRTRRRLDPESIPTPKTL